MPLAPEAQALLDQLEAMQPPPLESLSPQEARAFAQAMAQMGGEKEEVGQVEDKTIPGPFGDIPLRIYTPQGKCPWPALVYFHGGGWVIGDLEMVDDSCRMLANRMPGVVVSVDYRLAPEHKFPVAAEEAYTAVLWVVEQARSLGVDPRRVGVGGDSAGGNLSASVCLMARDRGKPDLDFQVLLYPTLDFKRNTPSYESFSQGYLLTREAMAWFAGHYLSRLEDAQNPYAAPLEAKNLQGLPRALVVSCEFDPLRDEAESYARRLGEAGTKVELARQEGMIHGFFTLPVIFPQALDAIVRVARFISGA